MESPSGSLIKWMKTFKLNSPHETSAQLSDGVAISQALAQISPEFFNPKWLSKIIPASQDNWRLKASNLKKVMKGILDYQTDILGHQIPDTSLPDVNAIAEKHDEEQLSKLLQLILVTAVNCERKQEYIEIIMGLEESVQHVVMTAIQELLTSDINTSMAPDSLIDLNDTVKRLTHELKLATQSNNEIAIRCHELDLQVATLQEEKSTFVLENDKLLEKLNHFESFEDPTTAAGRRFQQMQHKLDMLQDEVYKLETARDEYKSKSECVQRELFDSQQKIEEYHKEFELNRGLKDELDVLRHTSDKVALYESTIETYKKKLVDLSDMKRQIKLLEEKNASNVKQNVDLEEELKKNQSLRSQMDVFKKQGQELHAKLSEEVRRADKNQYESKRLGEKFVALQKEKERLTAERDNLKDTIEELKFMQMNKESEEMQGSRRASSSLPDEDMLDVLSPEIKERLIRLQHENKMLKLKLSSNEHEKLAMLQSLLDDSKTRQNELETENRLANQRIMELEGNILDFQENQTTITNQEGAELKKKLNLVARKLTEAEAELDKKKDLVERLEEESLALNLRCSSQQDLIKRKDEEMKMADDRYKKCIEKAKNVIKTIDPQQQNPDVILVLRNQLHEKEKLLANLERESQKEAAVREMETQLITSAFYSMSAQIQRKAADDRLRQMSPTPQTFLSRQRQATSKRLNMPGVATSEFFDF